jgi:predicted MFS family arabinose efflux permease
VGIAVCLVGVAAARSAQAVLIASIFVGALSVVAQILVAFAATLARPDEQGRVVGTVMSGLLLGILLARTAAGYLAHLGGWRTVFLTAAATMLVLAVALHRRLPTYRPNTGMTYPALIKSVLTLLREEPVLRLRSIYGAVGFGAFSALWTPLAFLLSRPPYEYASGTIGMFGLAGIAGALAASAAGRFADRGWAHQMTGISGTLLMASWFFVKLGDQSVIALIVGIVLLDLAAQALHITNQSQIYRLRPDARSRVTSAYMASLFAGGILGSALSSFIYAHAGWTGVCLLGAAFGAVAALLWLLTHGNKRYKPAT